MQTKTTYTVNVVKTLSGNQMDLTTLTRFRLLQLESVAAGVRVI